VLNAGMAKTFRQWNPEQSLMFPPTPMDWVDKDGVVVVSGTW
jgi:hypothetical protein